MSPSCDASKPFEEDCQKPSVNIGSSQMRTESTPAEAASARAPAAASEGLCPWASTNSWSMKSAVIAARSSVTWSRAMADQVSAKNGTTIIGKKDFMVLDVEKTAGRRGTAKRG